MSGAFPGGAGKDEAGGWGTMRKKSNRPQRPLKMTYKLQSNSFQAAFPFSVGLATRETEAGGDIALTTPQHLDTLAPIAGQVSWAGFRIHGALRIRGLVLKVRLS